MTSPFADGYRLIDGTELNKVTANPQWAVAPGVTATVGGNVTNSIKALDAVTRVTTAAAPNASLSLPQSFEGLIKIVVNTTSNQIVVFAESGSTVDGLPGTIGQTIPAKSSFSFIGTAGGWVVYDRSVENPASTTGTLAQFAATTSAQLASVISDETGTGALVFANSPALVSPTLGTPASGTLTNCAGLPIVGGTTGTLTAARGGTGITALGTGVPTALGVNVGTAGAFVVNGGALGAPASGSLAACTGLPIDAGTSGTLPASRGGTGLSALGAGVATFLGTPSSANLAAAVTDETGSGALVFGTAPIMSGVSLAAGTASVAPLTLASGTNLTAPTAGAHEYDGQCFYQTAVAGNRGVDLIDHFIALTSTNTLTSTTAAQPLFDGGGGPAGGAITLPAGMYFFECLISLSSLSASIGDVKFGLGGTATLGSIQWMAMSLKGTAGIFRSAANNAAITQADSTTTSHASISGMFRLSVGGTVVPQVLLGVAAAAVLATDSYFKCRVVGAANVVSVGNWS